MPYTVDAPTLLRHMPELCDLLTDAVESGASIGFLPPLAPGEAEAYWKSVANALTSGERILVATQEAGKIVGCVQLDLAQRANASHRAEVMKLMVHRHHRRKGLGRRLMNAIEAEARKLNRTLIVLDTRKGDPSAELYSALGYTIAGEIPYYARSASGELHTTVFFWKHLTPAEA